MSDQQAVCSKQQGSVASDELDELEWTVLYMT